MAKMIRCKGCGTEIYKGAKVCPQCGKKCKSHTGLILLGIIIALILVRIISGKISDSNAKKVGYIWPSSGIATTIPKPDNEYGKIISDSEKSFLIDLYFATQEDFNNYAAACKEKGYTVDYSGSSSRYSAKDDNGNSLSISYDSSDKELSISVSAYRESANKNSTSGTTVADSGTADTNSSDAEATEAITAVETTQAVTDASSNTTDQNTDFRSWVDSYESYMNEYVDFMKNYNPSDITSLAKYAQLMSKYAEFVSATDSLDSSNYSTSDWAYYMAAQSRVLEKLSQIQ